MARAFAAFVLVAVLTSPASADSAVFSITCEDGGRQGVLAGFGRQRKLNICDLDQSCDGICTVKILTLREMRCALGLPHSCDYEGHSTAADVSRFEAEAHCSRLNSYGVPVRASRFQRTFYQGRVMVRCRPSTRCTPTTTTTLPPGIPDLSGEWTLIELDATDDCPPAVKSIPNFIRLPEHHGVTLLQDGTRLFHCGGDVLFPQFVGTELAADGFTFEPEDCCSIGEGAAFFDVGQTLSGTLPGENGTASVTHQFRVSMPPPPLGPLVCTRTAHAVMSRIAHHCSRDEDCLAFGGCQRCIGGEALRAVGLCLPAPGCR